MKTLHRHESMEAGSQEHPSCLQSVLVSALSSIVRNKRIHMHNLGRKGDLEFTFADGLIVSVAWLVTAMNY